MFRRMANCLILVYRNATVGVRAGCPKRPAKVEPARDAGAPGRDQANRELRARYLLNVTPIAVAARLPRLRTDGRG